MARTILLVALVVAFLAGCGDEASDEAPAVKAPAAAGREATGRGYTATVPPGWHLAPASLTPDLVDPREILAVATFPLRRGDELCQALARIPPDQAFVTVQERAGGRYDFPRRPDRFAPDPALPGTSTWPYMTCVAGKPPIPMLDYWFGFHDARRAFHVFVGVGKEAPAEVRREAFELLDTLRLDPAVQPDWAPAG
jgi:hypothetical protein